VAAAIPPIPAPTTITFSFNSDVSVVGFAFAIASLVRGVEFLVEFMVTKLLRRGVKFVVSVGGRRSVRPANSGPLNEVIGPTGEKIICRKSSKLFVCKVSDRLRSGDSNSI
jgi:hypothetical protein